MSGDKVTKPQTRISFKNLQEKIEEIKQKRDELNNKTKEYINILQEIENKIADLLKTAKNVYKKKRDQWNDKVQILKKKKLEFKDLLNKLMEEKSKLSPNGKRQNILSQIRRIERKIESLERRIETENLDLNEENEIIDKIQKLAEKKEELLKEQKNSEQYILDRKIEIVKINLNRIYDKLTKWSDKSQRNHLKMLEAYEKVNELREKKRKLEELLIENKKTADQYHEQYLKLLAQKKKMNRGKRPQKSRSQRVRSSKPKVKNNNKQAELLEKIKQDKLAMALEKQKAGKRLNIFEARLILEQGK
ncbi:MAG: DUF7121 family protein [Promethearchaeia archaeon]